MVESKNCKKKHLYFQEFLKNIYFQTMAVNQSFVVYYKLIIFNYWFIEKNWNNEFSWVCTTNIFLKFQYYM